MRSEGSALEVVDDYLRDVNDAEAQRLEAGGDASHGEARGRRGSGEIVLTQVEFVDGTGQARAVATTGGPLTVRVHFRVEQEVDDPVFGLAFHHETGAHIAGPNSASGGLSTGRPALGEHCVDFAMDPLLLQPGAYVVTAAAVDSTRAHVYDYRDQAFALHVQPGPRSDPQGLVVLPGAWSLSTPSTTRPTTRTEASR
jgi:hypothetical protein